MSAPNTSSEYYILAKQMREEQRISEGYPKNCADCNKEFVLSHDYLHEMSFPNPAVYDEHYFSKMSKNAPTITKTEVIYPKICRNCWVIFCEQDSQF